MFTVIQSEKWWKVPKKLFLFTFVGEKYVYFFYFSWRLFLFTVFLWFFFTFVGEKYCLTCIPTLTAIYLHRLQPWGLSPGRDFVDIVIYDEGGHDVDEDDEDDGENFDVISEQLGRDQTKEIW